MDNYSQLPEEILEKIATEHLEITVPQLLAFSGVCKSWRSSVRRILRSRLAFPGLVAWKSGQSPLKAHTADGQNHNFLPPPSPSPSLSPRVVTLPFLPPTNKISDALDQRGHFLRLLRELAPSSSSAASYYESTPCSLGSKDGWILRNLPGRRSIDHELNLYLIDPITGAVVPLPPLPLDYFPLTSIVKAIVSSSPDEDGGCYVFILLHSRSRCHRLAWCKAVGPGGRGGGGQDWDFLPCESSSISVTSQNATYYRGKLYILEYFKYGRHSYYDHCSIFVLTTVEPTSATVVRTFQFSAYVVAAPAEHIMGKIFDLCELNGQLYVIFRFHDDCDSSDSLTFQAYKLIVSHDDYGDIDGCRLERAWSLDGCAIFVASHQSFSINPAADHLHGDGGVIRPDAIYFALNDGDENWMGVFHLPDQKLERFSVLDRDCDNHWTSPHYFWFLPSSYA